MVKALADLNEAIRLNPKLPEAYASRGIVHFKLGQFKEEIADYTEALRLDPDMTEIYFSRGVGYVRDGELDKAITALSEGIRREPKLVKGYLYRGNAYFEKHDMDHRFETTARRFVSIQICDGILPPRTCLRDKTRH